MEFVAGIVTGYLLTWPALVVLCLLAIFMEHTESTGWAVFFGLAALVTSYFVFSIPLMTLLFAAGGYLIIGTAWSFWRYKRFVSAKAKEYMNSFFNSPDHLESHLESLKASKNLGKITSWLLIWPFSVIENITGDIIEVVQKAITEWFHGVYESIFNSGTNEAYKIAQDTRERIKREAEEAKVEKQRKEDEASALINGLKDGSLNVDKDGVVR